MLGLRSVPTRKTAINLYSGMYSITAVCSSGISLPHSKDLQPYFSFHASCGFSRRLLAGRLRMRDSPSQDVSGTTFRAYRKGLWS